MDSYQAIYDAVRSRLINCDVGAAVTSAIQMEASNLWHVIACAGQDLGAAASEMQRPSVIYRPALSIDGNLWCALYGDNLQDGVCGFGESPAKAMQDFDANWGKPLSAGSPK